jgi:hypothetical protein
MAINLFIHQYDGSTHAPDHRDALHPVDLCGNDKHRKDKRD